MNSKQAAKLLRKDTSNLAKKVAAGRTLSRAERALLQSAATKGGETPSEWAANASQLAGVLGVHRQTIYRWLKQPGNPGHRNRGDYNIEEWRKWAETHGKRLWDSDAESGKSRALELGNEKLEFQLKQLREKFAPKAALRGVWTAFVNTAKAKSLSNLDGLVESIRKAPDSIEANELVRVAMLEIWKDLSTVSWNRPATSGSSKTALVSGQTNGGKQ